MIKRNINSMIKYMQNRKQSKDEYFLLPYIGKRSKYNQQRILANLGLPSILFDKRSHTDEVKIEREEGDQGKGAIKLNGIKKSNSMRKVKKYYEGKQNQADLKRSMRFLEKKINLFDILKSETKPEIRLQMKRIDPIEKPPHRYKTAILVFKHCLLLYGGLGCQKNLTWAKLNFEAMSWQISRQSTMMKPINSYIPSSPIYGHTMTKYKDLALIYGGHCSDEINEITIINTKTMQVFQGSKSPFRRKEHAAAIFSDFLVVHGGIQSRETKNQIFLYSIASDKWITLMANGLPALSSHKIAKGKNRQLYIFGGLNQKGKSTNKLYRIKNIIPETGEVKWELIDAMNSPRGRFSFCFEQISSSYLLLYGGREQTQSYNQGQGLFKGIFNDIHIYNMEKKSWNRACQNESLQYCFGMGSTSSNGSIFIFGGSNHRGYCDARISLVWNSKERNNPWDSVQASEGQICSSKRISSKIISS